MIDPNEKLFFVDYVDPVSHECALEPKAEPRDLQLIVYLNQDRKAEDCIVDLQLLRGRVRFTAGDSSCELGAGDFLPIPRERHSVDALEDSVLLLSVVK